jgi:hypothetical protein
LATEAVLQVFFVALHFLSAVGVALEAYVSPFAFAYGLHQHLAGQPYYMYVSSEKYGKWGLYFPLPGKALFLRRYSCTRIGSLIYSTTLV